MSDLETLAARLAAVERAVTDGGIDLAALEEAADLAEEIEGLDDRLDAVETRVTDLEAASQALRGYAGNVRAVNDEVERRANAALARVDAFEARLEDEAWPESPGSSNPPSVDPAAGEGWRDATGPPQTGSNHRTDESVEEVAHLESNETDDEERPDGHSDLRAVLRRFREAL